MCEFSDLKGKILSSIHMKVGDNRAEFITNDGEEYVLYHDQDCCEVVEIQDICGDVKDLLGTPILVAEEVSHEGVNPDGVVPQEYQDSFTWTFYKLDTAKGGVTIRWYGESNGFYSEDVFFGRMK